MNANIRRVPQSANPFQTDGVERDASGVARYIDLPDTLLDMLRKHVDATPDVEAVVEIDGERLSYEQLWNRAARVAGGLRAQAVEPGSHVALRYPAGVAWVLGFWGIIMAGAVVVAVNTRFTPSEIAYVMENAAAGLDLSPDTPLPDGEPIAVESLESDDVAALFYTSGTTSKPKGVPTTHEAFLSNAESMVRCMGVPRNAGASLRTLICVPLFHVTGCNSQLLTAALVGGTSVIMPALDRARLIDTLAAERISFLVAVPAIYALLVRDPRLQEADISAVRWIGYGGAPIAASLVRRIKTAFPDGEVFNGFGMTETASLITVLPDSEAAEYADSVGYAVPVIDLAVESQDESGSGELLVRGPNVTGGYWNRDASDSFIDGWLRTGDVVRTDESGRIYVIDRAKDMINRGGENVSSIEIEDALSDAPNVAEVAALPVPDEVMGEKIGVVLVAESGEIDLPQVIEHAQARLADFKRPQYASIATSPLPRNAAGKLLKANLRQSVDWGEPLR